MEPPFRPDAIADAAWIEAEFQDLVATNPWIRVPLRQPFVLAEDKDGVGRFATSAMPVPWSGPVLTARVLLLMLNPGYAPGRDERDQAELGLRLLCRAQTSGLAPFPWHLPRWAGSTGGEYWEPLLRNVTEAVGPTAVATNFASVQVIAYPSTTRVKPTGMLASQKYTARVVRLALDRGSLIVVGRAWAQWVRLIPELPDLRAEGRLLQLPWPRFRPYLTMKTLGADGFAQVTGELNGEPATQPSRPPPRRA